MPLFQTPNAKLIYFAHVPKCAGTTVERYLAARFGALALQDTKFGSIDASTRWSATSPQHMPEWVRARYIPDTFINDSFAIVRHPATRLRSVFLFQREIEGKLAADLSFEDWIETLPDLRQNSPHVFDGHVLKMTDFVPPTAQVFRIEAGLGAVINWLDGVSASTAPQVALKNTNVLESRLRFEKRPVPSVPLSNAMLERIAQLYATDYARFDYDVEPPAQESTG